MRKRGLTGSFWPSPTQETLLRLAFDPDTDVERAWRALQPLDLETLEPGTFAVLPFVYRRLEETGADEPRLPRLAGIYRRNWVTNQVQLDRLPALLEALRADGIRPLVIAGPAVATRYYDQLGLRPMLQLELLVSPDEAEAAASALERAYWRPSGPAMRSLTRFADKRSTTSVLVYAGLPAYFLGPVDPSAAVERLRDAAEERKVGTADALTLAPADELLLACGLGARRLEPPQLQWLVDVHQILASGEVEEARLLAQAQAHRLARPLRDTLAYLRHTMALGAPAEGVLRAIDANPSTRRERLAHRLAAGGLGPLGPPPQTLVEHTRASLDAPLGTAIRSLPRSMREAWQLERVEQVPLAAARKTLARIRSGTPSSSQPPGGRSRSASS